MKTIILQQPAQLVVTETPALAAVGNDEALVRVHRVGVCGTDYHAFRGRQPFFTYPRIIGHELGVEVLEVGPDVTNVRAGDRCAVEPYLNCGHCIACWRGKPNCCIELQVLGVHVDGGMREFLKVPARKLHPSPSLSLEQLALVETLGIGAHAVARAQIEPGEWALVIGAGPIGLSAMQFAQLAGAQVITLDMSASRLDFCRRQLGVEHALSLSDSSLEEVATLTGGDLPTVVFDATGNPGSMQQAFHYVAAGGRIVFVGLVQADISFHDPHFHRREITLFASRNSTPEDFRAIISLMEEGRLDTTPWITHRASCDEMVTQFQHWLEPSSGVVKAMVHFSAAT
jgi:2-desacetyl-2-hydroxyethyl bacteriochlorophyllide A dehydrogenase